MTLKSWQLEGTCSYCSKKFITTKYKIENNNSGHIFCSRSCYNAFRKEYYIGERASVYKRVPVQCSKCGKIILVPPNRLSRKNRENKTHIFCSKECYYAFRKEYYVGNRLYNTGIKMGESFCDKVRQATLRQYNTGVLNRQTKPQIIVNDILSTINVAFENEKIFGYYSVDNYLLDSGLIIEVMGDYFHANPLSYNKESLNDMQKKDIQRDMRKHTYISRYHNIEILYLWETDIISRPNLCENLISTYINSNGVMPNYHSFNYSFINDQLILNNSIINPYFIKNP